MILIAGNASRILAAKVAHQLEEPLSKMLVSQFSDGESRIEISDRLSGEDVVVIQSTAAPVNHHLMELLLITNAAKRNGARRLIAVIPYFGYARQCQPHNHNTACSAKLVADLLTTAGVDHTITADLHSEKISDFFSKPLENIAVTSLFINDISKAKHLNPLVVSPDNGGTFRALALAEQLNHAALKVIQKHRPCPDKVDEMNIEESVKDRDCIIVDDIISTGNTLSAAAFALKKQGARRITAYVTHPVLSENALKIIESSPLDLLNVTDTIPLSSQAETVRKIRVLSIAPLLAKAVKRISSAF